MKFIVQKYRSSDLWKLRNSLIKTAANPYKIVNFFKVKVSRALKLKKVWGFPINILIEPTRSCNFRCIHCARQVNKLADIGSKNPVMSYEQFTRILDELGKYLITVRLWHFGEPLLNPHFIKMVKYAKKEKIFTVTSSNLLALTPQKADELIDSQLDYLIISFNGATEEIYNKYANVNAYNDVVRNLRYFMRRKRERGSIHPFINLQFIIMRDNDHEIEEIKKLAGEMGVDKLSFKKVISTIEEAKKRLESRIPEYQIHKDTETSGTCLLAWEECAISSNGEVSPCATDRFNEELMGNVFDEPFKNIWNGKRYQLFRKRIAENIGGIHICTTCYKKNNPDFFWSPE